MNHLHDEMCRLATSLAVEAGEIAISRWSDRAISHKQDKSVVTDVDQEIQDRILSAIAAEYPHHAVLAEETVARPGAHASVKEARYVWVIDPLDGTRNYVAGFPLFSTGIGVLDRGTPVVGVVREHGRGDLYVARAGQGATRNGQPIHTSDHAEHSDVLLGFASGKDRLTVAVVQRWAATPGDVLRNTGSTAAQIALVACGALAGAFGQRVKLWDVVPPSLLVLEAGGKLTHPLGEPLIPFDLSGDTSANVPYLAADPHIHGQLVKSIQSAANACREP